MSLNEQYKEELLKSIPVVKGMEVDVVGIEDFCIKLQAPLNANINYEGTAFGGSLNTMCILSCYLMTHHLLKNNGIPFSSLVIQNSQIEYLSPVDGDFYAKASPVCEKKTKLFFKLMDKKKLGRIEINSFIYTDDESKPLVKFTGRFVASLDVSNV